MKGGLDRARSMGCGTRRPRPRPPTLLGSPSLLYEVGAAHAGAGVTREDPRRTCRAVLGPGPTAA
jgi:hypothetical protein